MMGSDKSETSMETISAEQCISTCDEVLTSLEYVRTSAHHELLSHDVVITDDRHGSSVRPSRGAVCKEKRDILNTGPHDEELKKEQRVRTQTVIIPACSPCWGLWLDLKTADITPAHEIG